MLLTVLFYLFIFILLIQLFYWSFLYRKFTHTTKVDIPIHRNTVPVSVIIAARNEANNLQRFLPKIMLQDYLDFEVIIVNDASTDETNNILKGFQEKHKNLKVVDIPATKTYHGNKKKAIELGIKAASYDHLLFTDADCYPVSSNWISLMTSHFSENKKIVLGYGAYKRTTTLINKLIRYETLLTAIQYFSYAKIGIPYMGVGRNLSYTKALFYKTSGFEAHKHIKSGDDDLFINQIATKHNTAICFDKNSFTVSKPKESYFEWFQQKRRHISTATKYRSIHQFLLGLFYSSQLLFWLLAIILLTFSLNWELITLLLIIRFAALYITLTPSASKLEEKDLLPMVPILDLWLVGTQLGLFLSNLIQKPKHW